MSGRKIGGVMCLVLAVLFFVSGIGAANRGPGLNDASGLGVSRAVGAFLPSVLALAAGLWLFQSPRRR
jgi:hypothetical protein